MREGDSRRSRDARHSYVRRRKQDHHEEGVHRLDLGINCEGGVLEAEECVSELAARLLSSNLKDYPDLEATPLKKGIGELYGLSQRGILLAQGLEHAIFMIASYMLGPGDRYLSFRPSFFLFEEECERRGAVCFPVPFYEEEGFALGPASLEGFIAAAYSQPAPRLAWLADPNNPSGRASDPALVQELAWICRRRGIFLVVDEAYGEYADGGDPARSAARLCASDPGIMVLRTFSKAYGLAGIRLGYAMCSDLVLVEDMRREMAYYPINYLTYAVGEAAFSRRSRLDSVRESNAARRSELERALAAVAGLRFHASDSSIIMLSKGGIRAEELRAALHAESVAVASIPRSERYVRVTIGSRAANAQLALALARIGPHARQDRLFAVGGTDAVFGREQSVTPAIVPEGFAPGAAPEEGLLPKMTLPSHADLLKDAP